MLWRHSGGQARAGAAPGPTHCPDLQPQIEDLWAEACRSLVPRLSRQLRGLVAQTAAPAPSPPRPPRHQLHELCCRLSAVVAEAQDTWAECLAFRQQAADLATRLGEPALGGDPGPWGLAAPWPPSSPAGAAGLAGAGGQGPGAGQDSRWSARPHRLVALVDLGDEALASDDEVDEGAIDDHHGDAPLAWPSSR